MLTTVFKGLGGLVGDAIEATKYIGSEIADVPGAFVDGVKEGLITTAEPTEEATTETSCIVEAEVVEEK